MTSSKAISPSIVRGRRRICARRISASGGLRIAHRGARRARGRDGGVVVLRRVLVAVRRARRLAVRVARGARVWCLGGVGRGGVCARSARGSGVSAVRRVFGRGGEAVRAVCDRRAELRGSCVGRGVSRARGSRREAGARDRARAAAISKAAHESKSTVSGWLRDHALDPLGFATSATSTPNRRRSKGRS